MDSGRNRNICRRFLNGSCSLGAGCYYRHELPFPASQICRYFQKGGCWYGDNCRYLHITQHDSVRGRRSSVPTVSPSSNSTQVLPDRRGSEPALLQAEARSRWVCGSSDLRADVLSRQFNTGRLATDITEEQTQDTDNHVTARADSVQSLRSSQASACGLNVLASSNERIEDCGGAAAAASGPERSPEELEAYQKSKNVTCGICMETVYEKPDPRGHVFGILPNCSHSFCLQCIMTWRKTKDLGPDTVKTCPQCRERSAFYVPNKFWVEGQEKERLIAAFKEKFSKKSCNYYSRYRHCPFKSECLYRHDKHSCGRLIQYTSEDDDYDSVDLLNLFVAISLLSGDDDDDDDGEFGIYLEEYDF